MSQEFQTPTQESGSEKKRIRFEGGKIYFDRGIERQFYFALTMGILILLFLTKTGLISH